MSTPKELQEGIEQHRRELAEQAKKASVASPQTIAWRQSEIISAGSQLAEISTRRIVCLTWALVLSTIALVLLTAALLIFTVALYKDSSAQTKRSNTEGQRDQLKQQHGTNGP
jgi:formiminotetrahydrofolate cyclodeaminase